MDTLSLQQLRHESDSWKRLLAFMTDENIHLKTRIADMLKDNFDSGLLGAVETFHNHLLTEDEHIACLKKEIETYDLLLKKEIFENGLIVKQIRRQTKHIRHRMNALEQSVGGLKKTFITILNGNPTSEQ